MKKRFCAVLLTLCLILPPMSFGVSAEDTAQYTPNITAVTSPASTASYNEHTVNWSVPENDKTLRGFVVRGSYTHTVSYFVGTTPTVKTFTLTRETSGGENAREGMALFPHYYNPTTAQITVTAYYTDGTSYTSTPSIPQTVGWTVPTHNQYLYYSESPSLGNDSSVFYVSCPSDLNHNHGSQNSGSESDENCAFYDAGTNTLTLKNYTIDGDLHIGGMGALTIKVIGSSGITGKIYANSSDMDIFIVNGNPIGAAPATFAAPF